MRITEVRTHLVDRWLLVIVQTSDGVTGFGEASLWAHPKIVQGAVTELGRYYVGKDPCEIEHHWQTIFRNSHFGGAVLNSALAALDIALWDILGKSLKVPVYRLLGGRCREKVRVYAQVGGETLEALTEQAAKRVKEGYTALRVTPFAADAAKKPSSAVIEDAVGQVKAVREQVGYKVDLGIEIHRRLNPNEAIVLAKALEPYRLFFCEDPVPPQSIEAMAYVASHVTTPIATGERLVNICEFKDLLDRGAARIIRPDVCLAGGLSHCRKIAALAEAGFATLMPHITGSPLHTAATVQLDASIPNYSLQDYDPAEANPPKSRVVNRPLTFERGYLLVPEGPGLGVELRENALGEYPYRDSEIRGTFHEDGCVADW